MPRSPLPLALAGIDLRALAVLRVGLGSLLLCDQAVALSNARLFYSDAGILPRVSLLQHALEDPHLWSLHLMGGSVAFQGLLLVVAMFAALALIIGWRTRLALIISWVLLCSLHSRNSCVLYGGDVVLRMLCFWSLFLPLGANASIDAQQHASAAPARQIWLSTASLAMLFQVAFIYWFTAILKYGNEWTRDGTALYYVFSADQFVHGLGRWLLGWPDVCRWLTLSTWWLEMLGPFIAFIPVRTPWWRLVVVAAMMMLHIGIALCMRLGMFPWVMVLAWVPFLPPMFWDRITVRSSFSGKLLAWIHDTVLKPLAQWLPQGQSPFSRWQLHFITQSGVALCLGIVFAWCLSSVEPPRYAWTLPPWARAVGYSLRLDQYWGLFAPTPIMNDGWLVMEAELYDHSHVDLLRNGQSLTFDKPRNLSSEYPDWKWQKLEANLAEDSCKHCRTPFGDNLARQWSAEQRDPDKKVRGWVLYNMLEVTLPHYHAIQPQKVELARNDLFIEGS
jgi:hypothetical protein